jgi:hypothetical protein
MPSAPPPTFRQGMSTTGNSPDPIPAEPGWVAEVVVTPPDDEPTTEHYPVLAWVIEPRVDGAAGEAIVLAPTHPGAAERAPRSTASLEAAEITYLHIAPETEAGNRAAPMSPAVALAFIEVARGAVENELAAPLIAALADRAQRAAEALAGHRDLTPDDPELVVAGIAAAASRLGLVLRFSPVLDPTDPIAIAGGLAHSSAAVRSHTDTRSLATLSEDLAARLCDVAWALSRLGQAELADELAARLEKGRSPELATFTRPEDALAAALTALVPLAQETEARVAAALDPPRTFGFSPSDL